MNSGAWQNTLSSLATEFSAEWTSHSEAVITVDRFEAGGGGIVSAEFFTQAPTYTWCDRAEVSL